MIIVAVCAAAAAVGLVVLTVWVWRDFVTQAELEATQGEGQP